MIVFTPPSSHPPSEAASIRMAVYQDIMKKENNIRKISIETSKTNMKKETNLLSKEVDEQLHIIYGNWPAPELTKIRVITKDVYRCILATEACQSPRKITERLAAYDELWPS